MNDRPELLDTPWDEADADERAEFEELLAEYDAQERDDHHWED